MQSPAYPRLDLSAGIRCRASAWVWQQAPEAQVHPVCPAISQPSVNHPARIRPRCIEPRIRSAIKFVDCFFQESGVLTSWLASNWIKIVLRRTLVATRGSTRNYFCGRKGNPYEDDFRFWEREIPVAI